MIEKLYYTKLIRERVKKPSLFAFLGLLYLRWITYTPRQRNALHGLVNASVGILVLF